VTHSPNATHVYRFTFVVFPKPSNPQYGEADGAYAVVFVNEVIAEAAEAAARGLIDQAGWDVEELDDWTPMNPGDDAPGTAWREYFAQAREDGICVAFHTWPVRAPRA
jgi:hypothetical protein